MIFKVYKKKRVWVCFVCNGVDIHMICKKIDDIGVETGGIVNGVGFFGMRVTSSCDKNAMK